ncbi:hypothetical protein [Nocardia sp. Marseille-Q1738]
MSTKFRDSVKLTRDFGRHPGTWLPPLLVLLVLSIALPAVYLGGTLNPDGNLRDLPIALVVEPQTSTDLDAAEQVRAAVTDGVDAQAIELIGGLIGIALGLVTTSVYDRNPAFTRHPSP